MRMTVKTTRGAEITGDVYGTAAAPVSTATRGKLLAANVKAVVLVGTAIHAVEAGSESDRVLTAIAADNAAYMAHGNRAEMADISAHQSRMASAMARD